MSILSYDDWLGVKLRRNEDKLSTAVHMDCLNGWGFFLQLPFLSVEVLRYGCMFSALAKFIFQPRQFETAACLQTIYGDNVSTKTCWVDKELVSSLQTTRIRLTPFILVATDYRAPSQHCHNFVTPPHLTTQRCANFILSLCRSRHFHLMILHSEWFWFNSSVLMAFLNLFL